jgi:head-tail adaptor
MLQRLSKRNQSSPPLGGLDRQITFQKRTATNADGQLSGAYTDLNTVFARIDQVAGKEIVTPAEFTGQVTTKFTTMDLGTVLQVEPRMRIKYVDLAGSTHRCDILFVNRVEERGFYLEILAKEIYSTT